MIKGGIDVKMWKERQAIPEKRKGQTKGRRVNRRPNRGRERGDKNRERRLRRKNIIGRKSWKHDKERERKRKIWCKKYHIHKMKLEKTESNGRGSEKKIKNIQIEKRHRISKQESYKKLKE